MARSKKPAIFEHLFRWRYDQSHVASPRWDEATQTIPEERRLVYSDEVLDAIKATNTKLGRNQAANFTKDFLRTKTRNANWPKSLADLRWTIKQITGRDKTTKLPRNFAFKPYAAGQTDPLPDEWPVPDSYPTHQIESVTLSVASKQIARLDEPRLMQIAADLRVVETHFGLFSPMSTDDYKVVHMDHLQMGLKLHGSEIDGLYLALFQDKSGDLHPTLITVEAKKGNEFINSSQIISQVERASHLGVTAEYVIPIALKHTEGGMFIFEYSPFRIPTEGKFEPDSLDSEELKRVISIFYEVKPDIVGLTKQAQRPKTAKSTNGQMAVVETEPDQSLLEDDHDEDDDYEDDD